MKLAIFLALFLCLPWASAAPSWLFWPVGGIDRVSRHDAPRPVDPLVLKGARGEVLSCQIVLSGTANQLLGCRLGVSEAIPGVRVVAHREHFLPLTASSPNSPLAPGPLPDALVPAANCVAENLLPGEKVQNQPFWVDLEISPQAQPGTHKFALNATDSTGARLIPVELTIWPISLPTKPTLASAFGLLWRRIAQIHQLPEEATHPELQAASSRYFSLLSSHWLTASEPLPPEITVDPDGSGKIRSIDLAGFRRYVATYRPTTLRLPLWDTWPFARPLDRDRKAAGNYLANLCRTFQAEGWGPLLYFECPVDEPQTPEQYQLVASWGEFLRETERQHKVTIPHLATAPTESPAGAAPLAGNVNVYAVQIGDFLTDLLRPHPTTQIRRGLGDSIWLYTSLSEFPACFHEQHGPAPLKLTENHPPVWCIDFLPMNFRILPWIAACHQISGLLYWDTLYWEKGTDPWKVPSTFRQKENAFQGDGHLIYPPSQFYPHPCPSMRLKWIRNGMQDHALITQAMAKNKTHCQSILRQVYQPPMQWRHHGSPMENARQELARLIVEHK